jgi:hypothetical protein
MVIPLPEGKSIGKPITKLCIIAARDQPLCPAPLPERPLNFPTTHQLCRKQKTYSCLFIHVLAVYDFHFRSIPFQELRSFLTLSPDTALHFHSNHTLQHRTASVVSFLSIPQAPLIQSVTTQAIFQRISNGMFFISVSS